MRAKLAVCLTCSFAAVACDGSGAGEEAAATSESPALPSEPAPAETATDGEDSSGPMTPAVGAPDVSRPDATSTSPNGSPATPNVPPASTPAGSMTTSPNGSAPTSTPNAMAGAGSGGASGSSASAGQANLGGDGSGGTAVDTNGGAFAVGGNGGAPPDDVPTPGGEPAIHYVGRFNHDSEAMRFEWSGSGMVAAFEGDSVTVVMEDTGSNQFTVVIDGEERPKLVTQSGQALYELASGLGAGPHTVELYRRTEASFGATGFQGLDFGGGTLLAPPAPPAHKLEIIGDSITCGYGNEGESATCGFSAETENHYATYGAIAARALDAELVTIAWSGKGIVYNYDTDTNEPLPELYDLTLPNTGGVNWDFSVIPDAVVINLGTNDFSTEGDPTPELFSGRYADFLAHLRDVYPEAYILCTVGPLLSGADLDAARSGIADAVATRQADGDDLVAAWELNVGNDDPGCDYHPGLQTHQLMADALVDELSARLGW